MKLVIWGCIGEKVGVEYIFGEFVLEDEGEEALNIEELKVDAGTGRALSFDPLEVGCEPILGEA